MNKGFWKIPKEWVLEWGLTGMEAIVLADFEAYGASITQEERARRCGISRSGLIKAIEGIQKKCVQSAQRNCVQSAQKNVHKKCVQSSQDEQSTPEKNVYKVHKENVYKVHKIPSPLLLSPIKEKTEKKKNSPTPPIKEKKGKEKINPSPFPPSSENARQARSTPREEAPDWRAIFEEKKINEGSIEKKTDTQTEAAAFQLDPPPPAPSPYSQLAVEKLAEELTEEIRNGGTLAESAERLYGVGKEELAEYVGWFVDKLKMDGVDVKGRSDFRSHFNNWLRIKVNEKIKRNGQRQQNGVTDEYLRQLAAELEATGGLAF